MTVGAEREAPLAGQVHEAFMLLMHRQRLLLQRVLAQHDLHPGQAFCLRVLSHRDGMSQREIADALMLTPASVTRMLQRMEKAGLVERGTDPADQRQAVVRITPAGTGLAALVHAAVTDYHRRGLARLSPEDVRELARLLRAWCDSVDADTADPVVDRAAAPAPPVTSSTPPGGDS